MTGEQAIVGRAKTGDAAAFEELFRRYRVFVWNVAYRMTYSFDQAEDVAQEVFVSAWRALSSFDGRSGFSTWLYRITVNKTLNRARMRRELPLEADEAAWGLVDGEMFMRQNPEAAAEELDNERTLARLLARLDPERRLAIVLREIEGLSYEEIAEATGVPVGTVRSRIARARRDLKAIVASLETEK